MLRFLYDTLFVVLADGSTQLVIIHGRTVFSFPPQSGNSWRVFDFENAIGATDPFDAATVIVRLEKKLFQEFPKMNRLLSTADIIVI